MTIEKIMAQYSAAGGVITPQVAQATNQPQTRKMLYQALLSSPRIPYRNLLLHLLQEEVSFREALSHGHVEDEGDFYEGIYKCAFLLASCADPSDILLLWKAKHTDMDVGSSMGAEYLIGAGLTESIQFLETLSTDEALEIRTYVHEWFSDPDALKWQKDWEDDRLRNIRDA